MEQEVQWLENVIVDDKGNVLEHRDLIKDAATKVMGRLG